MDSNTLSKIKPAFDSVWQSYGKEKCVFYDKNGNWTK